MHETGAYAHRGSGDVFVTEADESDGSFLRLGATVGIITNVEPDHLNYWGDFESLIKAFEQFTIDIGERRGLRHRLLGRRGDAAGDRGGSPGGSRRADLRLRRGGRLPHQRA